MLGDGRRVDLFREVADVSRVTARRFERCGLEELSGVIGFVFSLFWMREKEAMSPRS